MPTDRRARESERIARWSAQTAREALEDTRLTRTDALWRAAVEAVSRLYGVDPIGEDGNMQAPMENARVALVDLVDGLSGWTGLSEWVGAEHSYGAATAGGVIETAKSNPPTTIDEHLALRQPYMEWGMAFSNNLRHFQKVGHHPTELAKLRDIAKKNTDALYAKHGWPIPPESSIKPL